MYGSHTTITLANTPVSLCTVTIMTEMNVYDRLMKFTCTKAAECVQTIAIDMQINTYNMFIPSHLTLASSE